jgi:hypothetical protein
MSQDPQEAEKAIAKTLRLRGTPAPVAQVSRRALIIVGSVLVAGVAGAVSWSLMDKRKPATAEATYTPSPPPERVTALPRGYVAPASFPALGPPLPGDLGRPILSAARARQAGEPSALPVGGLERPAMAPTVWGEPSAEYWFLQRPSHWPAHGTRPQRRTTLSREGPWAAVPGSNLKLRMVSEGHLRDDSRLSKEIELVLLPGIEIRPIEPMEAAAFEAAADAIWFQLRILIMFCWRQYVAPLAVRRTRADGFSRTWHSVAIEARQREAIQDPHVFSGWRFRYLAGGAARLLRYHDEGERLHAAVFGYTQSFKALTLETGLTNCVEAIERLITLIESEADLEREIVPRKRWRSIARTLRKGLDDQTLSAQEEEAIKRSLASPPTRSLKERIERVIARQGKGWTQQDKRVLAGLEGMIQLRNAIVHGRLAGDITRLHVELVRSRAIFEGLFLNLLNLRVVSRSNSAASLVFQFEAMQAEARALAPEPPHLEGEATS